MRPILALDVDGVLNALLPLNAPLPPGWRDGSAAAHAPGWNRPHTFPIRYNPEWAPKLLALAEETGAELTWLTTWEDDANTAIAPLVGLPSDLPVVDLAPGRAGLKFSEHRSSGRIKALALRVYEPQRPVLWLDDDATAADLHAAAAAPGDERRLVALVRVNARTGLQDKHLERARRWLCGLRE